MDDYINNEKRRSKLKFQCETTNECSEYPVRVLCSDNKLYPFAPSVTDLIFTPNAQLCNCIIEL